MPKRKPFDCPEMKNRIQARILAGFEGRRNEFPFFVEFLRARTEKNERVARMTE